VFESPSSESRREAGLLSVAEHAYHRDERVRKLRVIPSALVSERNNKIAVLCIYALSQARFNLRLDAVDDLLEQRHIIVREVYICFKQSSLNRNTQAEKQSAHCDP